MQNYILLFASLLFYSAWDIKFTILLIFSSSLDFAVALALEKDFSRIKRRCLLGFSVVMNIGLLFFFKYYLTLVHNHPTSNLPAFDSIYKWGLPLGISFYTFQILSYTIDVYKRKIAPTRSITDFMLFVSFFPQLVAGPIEKARHLLPQIQTSRKLTFENLEQGFYLCLWGLFKKMYVANGLAYPIESYFAQTATLQAPETIFIFLLTSFQIYADFSGYSDIARGLAQMMGFEVMINFKPFWTSKNPNEFWQKWHISLTRWLRDYVFVPLHKRHESFSTQSIKVIFIMALVGIWHGASLNWLLFGLFNGLVIVTYQVTKKYNIFPKFFGIALLLCMYVGNSLLHRSSNWPLIQKNLFSLQNWSSWSGTYDLFRYAFWLILPVILIETFVQLHTAEKKTYLHHYATKLGFCVLCLTGIIFLERSGQLGFIYFDF